MVIGEGGPQRRHGRPEVLPAHAVDLLGRGPDEGHEQRHRVTVAARCQRLGQLLEVAAPRLPGGGVVVVGRLVHGDLADAVAEL